MKTMIKRCAVFVSFGIVAMILASCGGGGGTDTVPTPPTLLAAPSVTVTYGVKSVILNRGG
jgi:hypothetical protein